MKRQNAKRQRRAAAGQFSGRPIPLPLPLRGLYNRAKSAQVSDLFAGEMVNWRSNTVSLVLRPGVTYRGTVTTVLHREAFEFGTSSGYVTVTPTGASFGAITHSRTFGPNIRCAQISSNLIIADGTGQPVRFNGTAFTACAFTTTTGKDPATFDGVIAHQDRLFFWTYGDSLEFYSGDVGAVTGALVRYPLDRLGNITGKMAGMVSLTVDAGHGMNDLLGIITTTGKIVVYEGLDPTDAQDWRLNGRVNGAAPLGRDAFVQIGADVWMLTRFGIVSIGDSLRSAELAMVSDLTKPINDEIMRLAESGDADWQTFLAQDGTYALINRVADGTAQQFIYYLDSQSWSTADYPAAQFHNLDGKPEMTALDGRIGALVNTGTDETITATLATSWFNLGRRGEVMSIKPTIYGAGPVTLRAWVLSDHQETAADLAESVQTITLYPEEGGTRVTLSDLIASDAVGTVFKIRLEVTAKWAELVELWATVG